MAWAAAPSYSAANIVNNGDGSPGPFAPNSILSIFGTDLARSPYALAPSDIHDNTLPTELNYTRVYIDDSPVPLFYVSETQINFLVPSRQSVGPAVVHVMREGLTGPKVTIPVVDAAPALFANANYAIASDRPLTGVIAPDTPAKPGDLIVLWCTGLGKTIANPSTGYLPPYISEIVNQKQPAGVARRRPCRSCCDTLRRPDPRLRRPVSNQFDTSRYRRRRPRNPRRHRPAIVARRPETGGPVTPLATFRVRDALK